MMKENRNDNSANELAKIVEALRIKQEESERNKEQTITIDRIQVEINNPAIAQVVVEFPDSLKNEIEKSRVHFKDKYHLRNIVYEFVRTEKGWMVEVRSNMNMYKWFEDLIIDYSSYFEKHFPGHIIKVSGTWNRYDPHRF